MYEWMVNIMNYDGSSTHMYDTSIIYGTKKVRESTVQRRQPRRRNGLRYPYPNKQRTKNTTGSRLNTMKIKKK